jgi:preprotein translocase subunit Sec63
MPIVNITIDSYAVLGVSRDADIKEINAVYKQLALKSHPDKTGGTDAATERFREVYKSNLSSSRDTYIANAVPTDQRCR